MHERAIKAAALAACCGDRCAQEREGNMCGAPVDGVRAAIAAFLSSALPSDDMVTAGKEAFYETRHRTIRDRMAATSLAMLSCLAEEIDNAQG